MIHRKLTAGVIAGAVALLAGLGSGVVQAAPHVAVLPVVNDTTTTLPIMGSPLVIHVQTGPGGNISLAEITPAGDFSAMVSPNRVSFVSAAGAVQVNVKSKGNSQSISARAGSLADISGPGHWKGDVFGAGTTATVDFTIGESLTTPGAPDITLVTIAVLPSGVTGVVGATTSSTEDGEMRARADVTFTMGGQSRVLSISAKVEPVEQDDDDSAAVAAPVAVPAVQASLRITLSGFRGVPQDLATVSAGPQTWKGFLCDGTAVTVTYTVAADGTLSGGTVAPATPTSEVKVDEGKIEVRWATGERIRIKGEVNGTQITINVKEKIRCRGAADPTSNVSIVPNTDDHHGGDHGGKGNGGGDD